MKIYIILILIALTSATEWKLNTMEEWRQIHKTCAQRYPVSPEVLEKAKLDKYPPKEMFQSILCILRGIDVWTDTEGFSVDRLMISLEKVPVEENITKKFLRDSIERCLDNNSEKTTSLDWAYRCFNCFKDNEKFFKVLREAKFYEEPELL
ncbi:general odorant-binding protein 99a-like [Episyrphus balteatus]|uniref:general odorant-binding protein 99a-like n=1 Tax=Episyrphus balteatus TaxID=286459 RepID=UPI002485D1D9|nr:general odorant-binding protein 99a-like [Episyrphus balteatus]XP_055849526.1 general odorant-binding protein 99a-like [Episyrphus balteatus]